MTKVNRVTVFMSMILLLLASCTNESETGETGTEAPSVTTVAPDPVQGSPYHTGITIREIMASLIDPHADALWNSVRVVSDANGITEYYPETDAQWLSLRISAVTMVEGANALMVPGRRVAPPGAEGEFPEFEFTPEEVAEKLAADRQSWVGFAGGLQDAALELLDAVDNRDTDKLTEWGAHLDETCEACHAVYWYRAGI
jgi:hypothetical protein